MKSAVMWPEWDLDIRDGNMRQMVREMDSSWLCCCGHDFWAAIFTVIGCKTWRVLMLFGTTGKWQENHFWTRTHRPCCSKDNLQKWHWSSACWRGALEATVGRRQEVPFKMMWGTFFFLIIKASHKQKWNVPFIQNKIKDQTGDKKRIFLLISLLSFLFIPI